MTNFQDGRERVLAEKRARQLIADVEAAIVGDDVRMVELIREMAAATSTWEQMRAAFALAGPRFELGEYDDDDVADRRQHYAIALTDIDKLARLMVQRLDELAEGEGAS